MTMLATDLGVSEPQLTTLLGLVDQLERRVDALAPRKLRQELNQRVVEIRCLLRDGNLNHCKSE